VKLAAGRGGEGAALLVLLHGLGATRRVWNNFNAATRRQGSWIAPDLRGHGASPHATNYSLDAHATDVAELIRTAGDWHDIVVAGHSMGGAVALALASGRFGVQPSRVFALGIKVAWNDDELAGLRKMAAAPARIFETKDEAIARYLKIAGLSVLIAPDSPAASAGITQIGTGWRLAYDPATASVGAPPMKELMAAARVPAHLARGESDAMVTLDQLAAYDSDARNLPGGHNAMVENPTAVWTWIEEKLA
jgi:pimeloyl-ACP methyl ester carboxylesterase